MKNKILLLYFVCTSVMLLSGCGHPYVKKHPKLPQNVKDAINKGEVIVGMNEEQTKASIGYPNYKMGCKLGPNDWVDIGNQFSKSDCEAWVYLVSETELKLTPEIRGLGINIGLDKKRTGNYTKHYIIFKNGSVVGFFQRKD